MKKLCCLLLAALTLSCALPVSAAEPSPGYSQTVSGRFDLRLHAGKTVYTADEPIECYAAFRYVGTEDAELPFRLPRLTLTDAAGKTVRGGDRAPDYRSFIAGEDWDDSRYELLDGGPTKENEDLWRRYWYQERLRLEPGDYTVTAEIAYGAPLLPRAKRAESPVCTTVQTVSRSFTVLPAVPMPELACNESRSKRFAMRLYTDKPVYTEGEPIRCYAELEYIGKKEHTIIMTARPAVIFSLSRDGESVLPRGCNDNGVLTEYLKGEPARFDFFRLQSLPPLTPGHYKVNALLDASPSGSHEEIWQEVTREFTVKPAPPAG